jgi:hypothetical protein
MKNITKCLFLVLSFGFFGSGCRIARSLEVGYKMDIPNDIRAKGFRYVKKGVEARHVIKGIWPAVKRGELSQRLDVPRTAYALLWKAAGGLNDNQRLINVIVECSIIRQEGFSTQAYLVVQMYADVIEFDVGSTAVKRSGDKHEAARRTMALIQSGIQQVLAKQG